LLLVMLALTWGGYFVFDNKVSTLEKQADQLLAGRQPGEAEIILRQVENAEPWRKLSWGTLALQYAQRSEADKAVRILEPLGIIDRMDSQEWSILAQAYQKTGQTDKVESALLRAKDLADSRDQVTSSTLALVKYYRSQNRFEEALKELQQLAFSGLLPEGQSYEAVLLQTILEPSFGMSEWSSLPIKPAWLQQWGTAVTSAISESDVSKRWMAIGRAYAAAGEWDLAEYSFSQSAELSPEYAEAWGLLAEARQQQGKDGRKEITKAINLAPDSPAVRLLGALFYRRQHDYNKAISLLKQNLESSPNEEIWSFELGRTLAEAGRLEEAVIVYQQVVDLKPDDPAGYTAMARFSIQYEYRLEDIGLPVARSAIDLAGGNLAEGYDLLGQVLFALGKTDESASAYSTALGKDSEYAPTWLHIGQAALSQEDPMQAKEALLKAVSLAGNSTEGRLASRLLLQYFNISTGQPEQ
jgi:tetratricopeptide (TPR) repeat protein